MTAYLSPSAKQQYFNAAGDPLSGGKVYTYAAGTSTPKVTYTDSSGGTPNTNPVILDARGEAPIFWNGSYKIILKDSADATIWTADNITAADVATLESLAASSGSSLVGYSQASTYPAGTVGAVLDMAPTFIADITGATDISAAFSAMLAAGGRWFVPAGAYKIAARTSSTLTRDTEIVMAPDAQIVLDAAIGQQAFTVQGGGVYGLKVKGGTFDSSAVLNTNVGLDIGSVWDLNQLKFATVEDGTYTAGSDYLALKGDTAIDAVNCGTIRIAGNRFYGWADNAIYLTGGPLLNDPSDDGGPTVVIGNYFYKNSTGISMKRRNKNAAITGNTFIRNYVDVGTYEVSAGELQPGERFTVTGNISQGVVKAFIEARGTGRFSATGNRIQDWGYDLSNTITGNPSAIQIEGCSNCLISSNVFDMVDLAGTAAHVAVLTQNYTVGATNYTASNNFISGNQCASSNGSIGYLIYESASVGPSYALDNDCSVGVTNKYNFTNTSSLFSGLFAPGDWRMYNTSALLQRAETTGFSAPAFKVAGSQVVGAQITGYGTPTGASRLASFPGATATLAQTSAQVAQIIADLKTHGLLGS